MNIPFVKMQGLGNDFVLIDGLEKTYNLDQASVRQLCDRRRGIGADQLLLLKSSDKADYEMLVYNADGGEVEMCGNGIRCLGRYLVDQGLMTKEELRIQTGAGIIVIRIAGGLIDVDMGQPVLDGEKIPTTLSGKVIDREVEVGGAKRSITCVSMGNPHCVIYVDDLGGFPLTEVGPKIETDPLFPNRVNVEFVRVLSPGRISMRVWERGAGETMACGTGACAAVVASCLNGKTGRSVAVTLLGGELNIRWAEDDHVFMSGPAAEVFRGEIKL